MNKTFTLFIFLLMIAIQSIAQTRIEVQAQIQGHRTAAHLYAIEDSTSHHYNAQHLIDTYKNWRYTNGVYTYMSSYCVRYSANGDTVESTAYDNNSVIQYQLIDINGNGLLRYRIHKRYTSGILSSISRTSDLYNLNNKLVKQLEESQNIGSGVYTQTGIIFRRYTSANFTSYIDSTISFVPFPLNGALDVLNTTQPNIYTLESKLWSTSKQKFENVSFTTYYKDVAGFDSIVIIQNWDGSNYVNDLKGKAIYNSNRQVEIYEHQSWDASTNQFVYQIGDRYQRFTYFPFPLSAQHLKINDNPLRIYPQPASNSIKIAYPPSGDYNVVLYDFAGRKLLEERRKFSGSEEEINLSNVPTGNYVISIEGKQTLRQRICISK